MWLSSTVPLLGSYGGISGSDEIVEQQRVAALVELHGFRKEGSADDYW
jgi:hypothetical protein